MNAHDSEYIESLLRALFGRRSGSVYVLKAYCDEAGTHRGAVVMGVAGFLFKEKPYLAFERAWYRRLRKSGVHCFHMTDCVHGRGEFKHLKKKDRETLVRDLVEIIAPRCVHGFAVSLSIRSFDLQKASVVHPSVSDPYPMCVNVILGAVSSWCKFSKTSDRIAYFFEAGHNRQGEAGGILDTVADDQTLREVLQYHSHTFIRKPDMAGLQAADLLAWEWRRDRENKGDPKRWSNIPRKSLMALTTRGERDTGSAIHLRAVDINSILRMPNPYPFFNYDTPQGHRIVGVGSGKKP